MQIAEDKDMLDDNKTTEAPKDNLQQARLAELTRLLNYLSLHSEVSFSQNETR